MKTKIAIEPIARQVIERQLTASTHGLLELVKFALADSTTSDDASTLRYTGEARLLKDAAVWADNAPSRITIYDLWHFEPVPKPEPFTPDTLKIASTPNRLYQLWKKGTTIPFTGAADLRKYDEGWRAINTSYGYRTDPAKEPSVNAQVSGTPKPAAYLIYHQGKNAAITATPSSVPGLALPPPDERAIHDALTDLLARYMANGTLRLATMKITTQKTDSIEDAGDYADSDITIAATLVLLRPVISPDGQTLHAQPAHGDPAREEIFNTMRSWGRDTQEETLPCWDIGQTLPVTIEMRYHRAKTETHWPSPRNISVTLVQPAPRPAKTLRIRYTRDAVTDKPVVASLVAEKQL